MAKNLKLNIKNAQLAEAIKLNKVKKVVPSASQEEDTLSPAVSAVALPETQHVESSNTPPNHPVEQAVTMAPQAKEESSSPDQPHQIKANPAPIRQEIDKPKTRSFSSPSSYQENRQPYSQGNTYSSQPRQPTGDRFRPNHSNYPPRPSLPRNQFTPSQRSQPYPNSRFPSQGSPRPTSPGSGPRPFNSFTPRREGSGYPTTERTPFNLGTKMPNLPRLDEGVKKTKTEEEEYHKKKVASNFKEFKDNKPAKKETIKGSFDSRARQGLTDLDEQEWRRKKHIKHKVVKEEEVIRPKNLKIRLPITVKDLAAEMKLKASQLIAKLFMQGIILTLNDYLDDETTVQLLGSDFDCDILIDRAEEQRIRITEETIKEEIAKTPDDQKVIRPPIVTFMGHVDHGKTSLIDYIRKTNVVAAEAGAITQHIGAFSCQTAVGALTILDTPGHEAFSAMRTRGADITDIIVLVIAGDEGIKAQTEEAIAQAKQANVPIVVAINKSDKPSFNPENVYRQLSEHELLPESWGGHVITVNCSAINGNGIKELLEMLALQAEVLELKANPSSRARGSVIESQMHKGLGPVATVLVQNGSLRIGDALVFDQDWARIKTMQDASGKKIDVAGPSTPVKITGLSALPEAGSDFIAVESESDAKELAYQRSEGMKKHQLHQSKALGLEGWLKQKTDNKNKKILNLIIRADVQGSVEALQASLQKIISEKASLNIISAVVGEITESDAQLAMASKALILGFHTKVSKHAEFLIKQNKVALKMHDIIYHAVDDIKESMRLLLDKIPKENESGLAQVKAIFKASQLGVIAGCQMADGIIRRNQQARLIREGNVVWKGTIASVKRGKEDVREVSKGLECGILLNNHSDIREGDAIQTFDITYLEQEL
ncbi:MAG: translation initiation factor IF-2 [Rhabdochlamydiaceae bacterium]